jgi:fructose-1,6-bisphosphatase I
MDERVTLRSHLDRSALQTPLHGAALADVIKAIASASIELAGLIADGPFAGITGRHGGINSDGDQQRDIESIPTAISNGISMSPPMK